MIVRAVDGRFLDHPFLFSIEKERPWQRPSPASKFIQSSCQGFGIKNSNMKCNLKAKLQTVFVSRLALTNEFRAPVVSVSEANALCLGPALSVSGPGAALCRAPALSGRLCVGPGALCVGPRPSLPRRCLCHGSALSVSGPALCVPGALCVGAQHSWCRGPALCAGLRRSPVSVSGPVSLCRAPAHSVEVCIGGPLSTLAVGPGVPVSEPCALCPLLTLLSGPGNLCAPAPCVGARAL